MWQASRSPWTLASSLGSWFQGLTIVTLAAGYKVIGTDTLFICGAAAADVARAAAAGGWWWICVHGFRCRYIVAKSLNDSDREYGRKRQ